MLRGSGSGCELFNVAQAALDSMQKHCIEPTPDNYLVWFTHHSGENPALSRMIQLLEQNRDNFDRRRCEELYERFFGRSDAVAVIEDAGSRIQQLIGELNETLAESGRESEASSKRLNAIQSALGKENAASMLRKITEALLGETRRLASNAQNLGKELHATSNQMAILRASLERVRREAETDPLTGLPNRKSFDRALRMQASQALEKGLPLSLAVIDIDHFKRFNDTHGHQTGDIVLRALAAKLRDSVRKEDIAARFGGEEFALLLPETPLATAVERADRIRTEVARHRLRARGTGRDLGTITLSMGVAQYVPGEPLDDFFERADQALYAAKQGGRNRVVSEKELEAAAAAAAG